MTDARYKDAPPEGHPLRTLGKRLAELLDEDQWTECEKLLLDAYEHKNAELMRSANPTLYRLYTEQEGAYKMLLQQNAELRAKLDAAEKVVAAARASVANPAWAGVADEDLALEQALTEYEAPNVELNGGEAVRSDGS